MTEIPSEIPAQYALLEKPDPLYDLIEQDTQPAADPAFIQMCVISHKELGYPSVGFTPEQKRAVLEFAQFRLESAKLYQNNQPQPTEKPTFRELPRGQKIALVMSRIGAGVTVAAAITGAAISLDTHHAYAQGPDVDGPQPDGTAFNPDTASFKVYAPIVITDGPGSHGRLTIRTEYDGHTQDNSGQLTVYKTDPAADGKRNIYLTTSAGLLKNDSDSCIDGPNATVTDVTLRVSGIAEQINVTQIEGRVYLKQGPGCDAYPPGPAELIITTDNPKAVNAQWDTLAMGAATPGKNEVVYMHIMTGSGGEGHLDGVATSVDADDQDPHYRFATVENLIQAATFNCLTDPLPGQGATLPRVGTDSTIGVATEVICAVGEDGSLRPQKFTIALFPEATAANTTEPEVLFVRQTQP